jgi:hypothetical protein
MKKNNRLVTILYIVSRISLRFTQLILLFVLVFEFIPNGIIGNFHSTVHHSKGYPLQAKIQLNIPDTLINYKNKSSTSFGAALKTGTKQFDDNFNRIKKDNQLIKTYQVNTFEIYGSKFKDIKKEFDNVKIQNSSSELNIIVNPKNLFFKSILIVKTYSILVLILFVTYQCMHLFKELKTNFSFSRLLNQRIQNIGYSLIAFQVANMIFSIITMQFISRINYHHHLPSIKNSNFQFMNLSTTIEYNLEILFLGLCLVVLSKLLSYGYDLQNENELTI